jgi:hypothetical protein
MKNGSAVLIAVLAVGCVGLGCLLWQQRMEVNQLRATAAANATAAHAEMAKLQQAKRAAEIAQEAAERRAKAIERAASTSANASSATPSAATAARPQDTVSRIVEYLKDHPEDEALFARVARHNVDRRFPGLETLNLPREQLLKLKDLLANRDMDQLDAQVAAAAQGLDRGTPAWRDAIMKASAETNAGVQEILGPNANGVLAQLQVRLTFQNQVQYNLGPDFADAGAPISPEQSAALVNALADANYTGKDMSQRPADYNDTNPATGLTPHDLRILEGAAKILQPAQVEILKSNLIDVHKIQAIAGQGNSIVPVNLR